MEPIYLFYVRIGLFFVGVTGILYNTLLFFGYARKACHAGIAGMECLFKRLVEPIRYSYIYNNGASRVFLGVLMHVCIFVIVVFHSSFYLSFIVTQLPDKVSYEYSIIEMFSVFTGIICSVYLLYTRIRDKSSGSSNNGIVLLHLLLQGILWSWLLYYITVSSIWIYTAFLFTECFHAYFWTTSGYHPFTYIVRLYYSCKVIRQPDVISL